MERSPSTIATWKYGSSSFLTDSSGTPWVKCTHMHTHTLPWRQRKILSQPEHCLSSHQGCRETFPNCELTWFPHILKIIFHPIMPSNTNLLTQFLTSPLTAPSQRTPGADLEHFGMFFKHPSHLPPDGHILAPQSNSKALKCCFLFYYIKSFS